MSLHHASRDSAFCHALRDQPKRFGCRYSAEAEQYLLRTLFMSLADDNPDLLHYFFPIGTAPEDTGIWKLSAAQGAVDGAEYTEAARGKRCGHVFRNGEATYCCRTCTADDTCVLCAKCFEASNHEGHQVQVSMSLGATGCCDCGDSEAFVKPVDCAIHSARPGDPSNSQSETQEAGLLPEALRNSIRSTVRRALDYLCDVFSCAPEHMRLPKSEELIRQNEQMARLRSKFYGGTDQLEKDDEFALVLWNDEKHTVDEVQEQVAKALSTTRTFALKKAAEVDAVGRSIIQYSTDLQDLLHKAQVIERIKVTVTIRSSRDTFREQMCGTIIDWLSDIAGCSVGGDHHFLLTTICDEMLLPWRIGSEAFNMQIGKHGLIDHMKDDDRLDRINLQRRIRVVREAAQLARAGTTIAMPPQIVATTAAAGAAVTVEEAPVNEEEHDDDDDELNEDNDMDIDDMVVLENGEVLAVNVDNAIQEELELAIERAEQAMAIQHPDQSDDSNEDEAPPISERDPRRLLGDLPKTPKVKSRPRRTITPGYWYEGAGEHSKEQHTADRSLPVHEDLDKRVRIDFLILYDLRMWKKLRNTLRHLYITTVITIPSFKRVLGLRFAALYTWLAQLYLIADREPDHSIINLSLQMLTTPSITAEIVERGKFFTKLLAILYTFLTKRQVGHPDEVDPTAMMALDAGVVTNRRIHHFFQDMRYLLDSPYVQAKIRDENEYLLQFIDYVKLYQGICPNVRAIGEHIEYESDAWLSAGMVARDVTHVSRQFCDSFRWKRSQEAASICRAIRQTAKATIINSLGAESQRFMQAEMTSEVTFKPLGQMRLDVGNPASLIIDCVVEASPMSFHHALHYTLSWLIDAGKSMAREQLQGLLEFTPQQLSKSDSRSSVAFQIPVHTAQEYLLALFDIPLRVCVWLSQMRTGLWVRNGMTLRHQMSSYRSVGQRDLAYQRDIFLLQVAFVVCPPELFLASMVDRFGLGHWVREAREKTFESKEGFEESQWIDISEDFIHLLITILSDRTLLTPFEEEPHPEIVAAKKDIAHALCFKPMSHSELTARLSDKVQELAKLSDVLDEVAVYRAPEGLSDVGVFELREQYYDDIDPYQAYYSKNQREEAESLYRARTAKKTNQLPDEVVYEPHLRSIRSGVFSDIGALTRTPLFAQIIFSAFVYAYQAGRADKKQPPLSRIESFLQMTLHLALLGLAEDKADEIKASKEEYYGFSDYALRSNSSSKEGLTIVWYLVHLQRQGNYPGCNAKLRQVLSRLRERRPQAFFTTMSWLGKSGDALDFTTANAQPAQDPSDKKKQALERQARVMANFKKQQDQFLENQAAAFDWGVEEDSSMEDVLDRDDEVVPKNSFTFPSGTCIFCQEDTGDHRLYGTLALMCGTNVLRETDLSDLDYIGEVLATPCNLDESADDIRPFGVAGGSTVSSSGPSNMGSYEKRGLGKGFPPSQHKPGAVFTSCGHLMHWSCFKTYDLATHRRQGYQVARQHPERLRQKEFVCPLCKALGNAFLPIVWKTIDLIDPRHTHAVPFDVWLKQAYYANPPTHAAWQAWRLTQYPMLSPPQSFGQGDLATPRVPSLEVKSAYLRLHAAVDANGLSKYSCLPPQNPDASQIANAGFFARALGSSIAATEISCRGHGAIDSVPITGTYLDAISPQAMTHLRILSENTTSYIAALPFLETYRLANEHLLDLLRPGRTTTLKAVLSQDPFIVLTECSVSLVPLTDGNALNVMRLCCYAEIVKVVLGFVLNKKTVLSYTNNQLSSKKAIGAQQTKMQCGSRDGENFSRFVQGILDSVQQHKSAPSEFKTLANPNYRAQFDQLARAAALSYVLPFLRKALLLLHVQQHWDITAVSDTANNLERVPELTRLSRLLGLPSFDDMIIDICDSCDMQNLVRRWTHDWLDHYADTGILYLTLPHPAIYELVALPKTHDSLNSAAMARRCPKTHRELNDPCICLFCGDIFCGQAQCCSVTIGNDTYGGCYRHQMECAGNIGMFLNIRKCAVLFLNGKHGSFQSAPYLDRHGEPDMGLRRRNQLFLNRKRYDKLFREVWLNHGVPHAISRKLEQDVNTGGWESL